MKGNKKGTNRMAIGKRVWDKEGERKESNKNKRIGQERKR